MHIYPSYGLPLPISYVLDRRCQQTARVLTHVTATVAAIHVQPDNGLRAAILPQDVCFAALLAAACVGDIVERCQILAEPSDSVGLADKRDAGHVLELMLKTLKIAVLEDLAVEEILSFLVGARHGDAALS